ncbi:hypothetical protein L7F22_042192 [Adiantum nelumboides]|nr:hypothetical protein [Adiantum nelumboides]
MTDIPPDMFKIQCMYAASYIAYEFCSEYAYAMEEGLRLAKSHFKEQEMSKSNGEDVSHEEVETILQAVRSKSGNAIDVFNEHQLQTQAKLYSQQGKEKKYKHQSEITMKSILLDRRYHTVAKKIIECIFEEYQAVIEEAKAEALTIVHKNPNRGFENAVEVLVSTIHDRCRNFRLSLIAIRQKVEPILSVGPLRQVNGQSQGEKLADLEDGLFKHDDTDIDLDSQDIVVKRENEEQSVNRNISLNTPRMLPPNSSSTDTFLSNTVNHSSSSEMTIDTSQVKLTTPLGILPEANPQEQSAPGSSLQTANPPQSLAKQALSSIPEKRKHVDDPPAPTSKKSQLQDIQDHHALNGTMVQNHDQYDSSDDDIEITGVFLAGRTVLSEAGSSNRSTNTTRPGVRPIPKSSTAIASASFKAQTAPRHTTVVSNRALNSEISNQGTAGLKENSQSAQRNLGSLMRIDQILEKGFEIIKDRAEGVRKELKAILNDSRGEFMEVLKNGLSSDAVQLIVAIVNGEDIDPKSIRRIHNKGKKEGKISAMMLFIASHTDVRQGKGSLPTQSTYKTCMSLTVSGQKYCINDMKNRLTSYNKAAYDFLNAEQTQNCEKLCIPIWSFDDALESTFSSKVPLAIRSMFEDDDQMVREVAHLVRCVLMVVCWTIQDDELDLILRRTHKRGKPFIGLNNIIPFDVKYNITNTGKKKAEESTTGEFTYHRNSR